MKHGDKQDSKSILTNIVPMANRKMRQVPVYIYALFLLAIACGQVDNKKTNTSHTITSPVDTISSVADTKQIPNKDFDKGDFDISLFIHLADSLLTSIDKRIIKLNYTVDSTLTTKHKKKRFEIDPVKGKKILRFWVELSTYTDKSALEKDFIQLKKGGWDKDKNDMIPGLTYTNDYVIKTDNNIVWLNTGCSYAYFNHQKVKQILLKSLNIGAITDSIICKCGGSCEQ